MRRATVGSGTKDISLLPSARAPSGDSSRARNGGLFSSSSSSSGDSDASDGEKCRSQRVGSVPAQLTATSRSRSALSHSLSGVDFRRRTMFSSSSTVLSSSTGAGDNGGHSIERKGLFENDDDTGDSLEMFHERVKLRQSKKQSEMMALRAQLEMAQQRAEELETRLSEVTKESEEFAIRTKECQRIIEKRNKQLMKASEKMARRSEQFELQVAELQTRVTTLTTQRDQLRAEATTVKENSLKERALKEKELLQEMEMQKQKHEKLLHAVEARAHEQQVENAALEQKLREIEQQLTAPINQKLSDMRVVASKEYRSLLKQCKDTEAISRGLQFQLEKEQQEKNYLRKQLTALQETVGVKTAAATAASVGFLSDTPLAESKDVADDLKDTTATVITDAELMSFDFAAGKGSLPSSPVATEATAPAMTGSPISETSSLNQSRSRGLSASSITGDAPNPLLREGKRRAASAQMIKSPLESPNKPTEAKVAADNSKSIAASVTFFEKLSSRFKRGSSPRNGLGTSKSEDDGTDGTTTGEAGTGSPFPSRRRFAHSKVLKERPRMYVAKSPSHDEDESSDSIFGSESSLGDSSDDDVPPPPPPPPISVHVAAPPFTPPVHVDSTSQVVHLDASADADSSSSSDDEFGKQEWHKTADQSTRVQTRGTAPLETRGPKGNLQAASGTSLPYSSSSSSSEDDSDEPDSKKSHPLHLDMKKSEDLSESSSSISSSSDDDTDHVAHGIKRRVHPNARKENLSGQGHRGKRSSRSPTSSKSREKSLGLSGGDNLHGTSKSRMNEYMEARAKKRKEKIKRTQLKEQEETIKKEEYEKEWEKMAQEERERKRKQQQTRRNGRRRPTSMKTVRVSQMRQQMNNKQQHKDQKEASVPTPPHANDLSRSHGDDGVDASSRPFRRKSESKTSESEADEDNPSAFRSPSADSPPLPPEATVAETELYLRQQARLRERHELQMKKKIEADEADAVRGDIHRRVEMWAFGKKLLHMILTLDQITSNDALKKCQLMVVQSPDDDTVRKAYRNIIRVVHPDKLRGATIPEQLEAKELFTVLNQAFEKFKNQTN